MLRFGARVASCHARIALVGVRCFADARCWRARRWISTSGTTTDGARCISLPRRPRCGVVDLGPVESLDLAPRHAMLGIYHRKPLSQQPRRGFWQSHFCCRTPRTPTSRTAGGGGRWMTR
eukprot:1841828-Rhodomonas_salina.2